MGGAIRPQFLGCTGGPAGHYQRNICQAEGKTVRRKHKAVGIERRHERRGSLPTLFKGSVLLGEAHTGISGKVQRVFNQAIEKDPNYAPIPAAAQTPKVRGAAQKALAIDDSLAEAHAVLGGASQDLWEWDAA